MATLQNANSKNHDEINWSAFGIGCFNFRYEKPIPYEFNPKEYIEDLTRALERITSLSDLSISYPESLTRTFSVNEEIPTMEDGFAFPNLMMGEINFQLYIPKRVQCELIDGTTDTNTEKFKICLKFCFYGAVTFIECLEAGKECGPSTAVQIVREYLKKEFKNISGPIKFECLGPSPFHMDFFACSSAEKTSEMVVAEVPLKGYDRIEISHHVNDGELLDEIYFHISDELDVYYQLIRENMSQQNKWESLENNWELLRNNTDKSSGFFQKFVIHKQSRELITQAYNFTADNKISSQRTAYMMAELYGKDLRSYFKIRLESKFASTPDYPVQALLDWAKHIHESSFKLAQIAGSFSSALLGGLVGALLTAALKGFFKTP